MQLLISKSHNFGRELFRSTAQYSTVFSGSQPIAKLTPHAHIPDSIIPSGKRSFLVIVEK